MKFIKIRSFVHCVYSKSLALFFNINTSPRDSLSSIYVSAPTVFFPQLNLANPGQVVIDKLHASNFANLIGQDKIFLSVADAVLSYAPKMEDL